jgi:antirestriction protein
MSESKLQREFRERDVQRMRNLITKDYSAKTQSQVGYSKEYIERNEGDIWEENNKTWTIKNGIKMTVSKLDDIKKILQLPLVCPKCSKHMKNYELNRKMYSIHKMCFDCVIEFETKLKVEGTYKEYERNLINKGLDVYIKELEDFMLELALNSNEESFITEAGDIEKWSGGNIDKQTIINDLAEYINSLKEHSSL